MKRIIALVAAALLIAQPSFAQQKTNANYRTGVVIMDDNGVANDSSHPVQVAGSFSATLAGFTPNGNVANLSVTTSSANVALPAGTVIAVLNSGATDASIKLSVGAGSAATTDFVLKSGATVGLTPDSNTFINAITASSTTTLSMAGGTGLVSGYGGGGSGGSGGAVTNAGTFAVQPAGSVAHDGVGTGVNPVLEGCYASAAAPAEVSADGDAVRAWCLRSGARAVYVSNNGSAQGAAIAGQTPSTIACQSLTSSPSVYTTATTNPVTCNEYGAIVTQPYALQDRLVKGTTSAMTGTTSTSLIAAPGAGLKNYITTLSCVNSHATVGTFVTVQDGSGGTAIWTVAAAALFGGTAITFPAPLQQPTANTALFVADVTTGAAVICSASGYKAP